MLETLKEFVVSLRGDVDEASMAEAEGSVDSLQEKISGFAMAAGGAIMGGAFVTAMRNIADHFNDLGDVAERTGNTTVEELDRLGYAATLSGSDAQTAMASFESLSKTIGEAASGVGRGAQVFESFGLSAKNADGSVKSVGQVMDDLRGKLADMSAAEQQATIQRLGLDRTMIGMLTSDTSEIEAEYDKRTKALGINADEMAEISGAFNDSIAVLSRSTADVFTSFVMRILPGITRAIETVSRFINQSATTISKFVAPIAGGFDMAVTIVTNFMKTIFGLVDALGSVGPVIMIVVAAVKALNMAMSMSPMAKAVTAIAAVISVLGLLYDDFQTAKRGGESFFKFWPPLIDVVERMSATWDEISRKLADSGMWDSLTKAVIGVKDTITGVFSSLYDAVKVVVAGLFALFTGDFGNVETAWGDFIGSLSGLAGGLTDAFTGVFGAIGDAFSAFFGEEIQAVKDWISNMIDEIVRFATEAPKRIKDATVGAVSDFGSKIAGWFGFGDDGSKDGNAPTTLATAGVSQNSTSNVIYNNQRTTTTQTYNVRSPAEAAAIANQTTGKRRINGGVGG